MRDIAVLQRALAYTFADPALLSQALTHRSVGKKNNERLEFLGDSILNHVVAEALYQQFPDADEGDMSRMRAALVKGDTLAEVATTLALGDYIKLGPGERKSGGHRRASILADALEAILGAILCDSDAEQCKACVQRLLQSRFDELGAKPTPKDSKTELQEYLQGRHKPLPSYELLDTNGDEHNLMFRVNCILAKPAMRVQGQGSSRRKAEQAAAGAALERIRENGN